MRANIRGGGGDTGKCTIEVNVDGVADVEVRGDMGYLRTLQGQQATWRRFECNAPIPRNPADFRFRGVDGRGNVQLMRDPNSTGGTAVVRVEDRQNGREGYTFDLEWRGTGTYSSNDPYYNSNDPYYRNNDPNYRNNDPYYRNNDPYYGNIDPYYNNRRNTRSRSADAYGYQSDAVGMCQDAVRTRARNDYGVRNPYFLGANVGDLNNNGNRDRVVGSFEGRQGERYDYSCTVNTRNGNIRNVDIRRR